MSLKSSLINSDTNSDTSLECINDKILASLLLFCVLPFLLIDIYFAITSANCSTKDLSTYSFSIEIYLIIDIIAMYIIFTMCLFTIFIKNPNKFLSKRNLLLLDFIYIVYSTVIFINGSIIYIQYSNNNNINNCKSNAYIYILVNSLIKFTGLLIFTYKKYIKYLQLKAFENLVDNVETVKNDLLNNNINGSNIDPYTVQSSINNNNNNNNNNNV
jgi:hypothetical protein